MRYRINRKTSDRISKIGLGSAYMPETPLAEALSALRQVYEGGINYSAAPEDAEEALELKLASVRAQISTEADGISLFFSRCLFNILSIDNIDNYAYNLFIRQKGVAMMKLNLMCMCSMCMRWPASCPLCVHKQS